MKHIIVFLISISLSALATLGSAYQRARGAGTADPLELTETDLFSTPNWNSRRVSILGFRLGMDWPEALAEARRRSIQLVGEGVPGRRPACSGLGWCTICAPSNLCNGLALDFGTDRRIATISITKIGDEAEKEVRENAIERKFKGATLQLFENYSKDLRLRLLGPENTQNSDLSNRSYTYVYQQLGLIVEVIPCPAGPIESRCASLRVELRPPK